MNRRTHRFDVRHALRSFGLFALVSMMLAQFIAPAVSASSAQNHDHHITVADAQGDCPMMPVNAEVTFGGTAQHHDRNGDTQDTTAHCKISMCCFHGVFSSPDLVAVATLLPAARLAERGVTATSRQGGTKDRPPRHL